MQDPFWKKHYQEFKVQDPSGFAKHCASRYLRPEDVLVELGCGNGRDGMMLSSAVSRYVGMDACGVAVESFNASAKEHLPSDHHRFDIRQADFTDIDFESLAESAGRLVIYSRFSLHAITHPEQERLMRNLERISRYPWIFLVEARTIFDELYGVGENVGPHEYQTDHYRRFIDPNEFLQQVSSRFDVKYFEVAKGFSSYGNEDPVLMRAMFQSRGTDSGAEA